MAKTKGSKTLITVSVDTPLVRRLDDLADTRGVSRSSLVEQYIAASIEEDETAVRVLNDPVLMRAFSQVMGDRQVLKRMAVALTEEVQPEQLELFQKHMARLADEVNADAARLTAAPAAARSGRKRVKKKGGAKK